MLSGASQLQWADLSRLIGQRMGLHFPPERWADLRRGLASATSEFGFGQDVAACVGWLLSAQPTRAQWDVLASHLTIGETYFFRDRRTLKALAEDVLPGLIESRRGGERRLRVWSAGCSTGEEPYSLAILLHRLLPDLADWQVTITATDINERALHKAAAGVYREWSFRDAPSWLKPGYFSRAADGHYSIVPSIKKLVRFARLNLVEDVYPSLQTGTNAMDLIFCRNVLMYFSKPQIDKVIASLHHSLVEGGCLAVAPSEASQARFAQFAMLNFPGAILYRKDCEHAQAASTATVARPNAFVAMSSAEEFAAAPWAGTAPAAPLPAPVGAAESLYHASRHGAAIDARLVADGDSPADIVAYSLMARALANQGRLAEALVWCERWIAGDKLDPAGHYLHAVVLTEQGDAAQARASLLRSVYLDHDRVLAHFALGNLARGQGKHAEANKHFSNALVLLGRHRPDDVLPESDGLTAGRLAATLAAMTNPGISDE